MSAPLTPAKTATAPRAAFTAASFDQLRAAAGVGPGEVLRIPLADIDEDPDQPRTIFDEDSIESMAQSIRAHGVVQPVVVHPAVNGRYLLAFGARRLRASRVAGVADIPAVVRSVPGGDFAAQVIENQQHVTLANSDLAAAIERLTADGLTIKEIAVICAIKAYQVSAFRQVQNFPAALACRIDHAEMRALYELYRQWCRTPEEVIASLPAADVFLTVTEARRITEHIKVQANGGRHPGGTCDVATPQVRVQHASKPQAATPGLTVVPAPPSDCRRVERTSKGVDIVSSNTATHRPSDRSAEGAVHSIERPTFVVKTEDGTTGTLLVDRWSKHGGCAVVAFPDGFREVAVQKIRIVRIE